MINPIHFGRLVRAVDDAAVIALLRLSQKNSALHTLSALRPPQSVVSGVKSGFTNLVRELRPWEFRA